MQDIKILHIEDLDQERKDMTLAVKKVKNLTMVGSTGCADEGLDLVKKLSPNVIILDLELRDGSKDGLYFLKELEKLRIQYKPFIIVTTMNSSEVIFSSIRKHGADFIYCKTQKDYGPDLVIGLITNILEVDNFENKETVYSDNNAKKYVEQIYVRLGSVSMDPRLRGYRYIKDSMRSLYDGIENYKEVIINRYGTTAKKIEDDMQYAIKKAWLSTDIEVLRKNYTGETNPKTGIPTVRDFIYHYHNEIIKSLENRKH